MDGNPLLNPVGSLPPQVYWRRRAMAGLLVVLVVWFAWTVQPFRSGANAAQSPTKSAGSTPSALAGSAAPTTPVAATTTAVVVVATTTAPPTTAATVTSPAAAPTTPAAAVVPQCGASSLQLKLTADHTVYAAGVLPHFVLTVTNVGAATCRVDVGTAARGFVVTSGTDRIWSSSDCTKTSSNVAPFTAKASVSYAHTWNRQRSTSIGCAAAGTQGRPGTYKVVAHVGSMDSNVVVFRLA